MKPSTYADTAYTDEQAAQYDKLRFGNPGGLEIHQTELGELNRALSLLPAQSVVVEVGCGTGRLLSEVAAAGHTAIGIDGSEHMLRQLKEGRGQISGTILIGDAAFLPVISHSVDLVYSIRLLNQTANSEYALASIVDQLRIVKPGGLILVEYFSADRPRLPFGGSQVRLRRADVESVLLSHDVDLIHFAGPFLLGMRGRSLRSKRLRSLVRLIENIIPRSMAKFSSRCYVLGHVGVRGRLGK